MKRVTTISHAGRVPDTAKYRLMGSLGLDLYKPWTLVQVLAPTLGNVLLRQFFKGRLT